MRMTLICAAAIIGSTTATAQNTLVPITKSAGQVTPPNVTAPSGSFLGGSGTCAGPTVVPAGPTAANFPYDNTAAASGGVATNPFEALCQHSGQLGIDNEEWWSWTAMTTGTARLNTCSDLNGVDTKVAIYNDDCANILTLDPISCKDDDPACTNFTTTVVWDCTAGTNYLIQLGTFATAPGGIGDFQIEELPPRPAGQYDLGTTANAFGPGATGGDILWLQTFEAAGPELVMSVDAAWGTPPGAAAIDPDGSPGMIAVYQGDPVNGMTLVTTEAVLTAMSATDTPINYPLTTPAAVTGTYTVGVMAVAATGGTFPASIDQTINGRGRSFLAWDNTGVSPINLMDPTTAPIPPTELQFGFGGNSDGVWFTRVNTVPNGSTFNEFCFGDGGDQMGCVNCPCSNNAPIGSGGGCLNSSGDGIQLNPSGDPSVSLPSGSTTDLRFGADGAPAGAFCILNSGDALAPGNPANPCFGTGSGAQSVTFDGLRCAITATRRHGGRSADLNGDVGVTNNPWGGEGGPPVGLAIAFGGFSAGQTRYFQIINRDDALAVCMRGLNTSQAVEVTFTP